MINEMSSCRSHVRSCSGLPPSARNNLLAITLAPSQSPSDFWMRYFGSDTPICNPAMEYPEEGVYLSFTNRVVQIAAAFCGVRTCQRAKVCSRPNFEEYPQRLFTNHNSTSRSLEAIKPCDDCVNSWLDLDDTRDFVDQRGMILLAQPRTLHCTVAFDQKVMVFDDDEEIFQDEQINTNQSHHISWMHGIWNEYLVPIMFHTPRTAPSSASSPSRQQTLSSSIDDECDLMGTDIGADLAESFCWIRNDEPEDDEYDSLSLDQFLAKVSRNEPDEQPQDQERNFPNDYSFIFGLDDLGEQDGYPDMEDFSDYEDDSDDDFVPATIPSPINFVTFQPVVAPQFAMSSEPKDLVDRQTSPSPSSEDLDAMECFQLSTPSQSSDSDESNNAEDMGSVALARYHSCTQKPCSLGCQDPESSMIWQCNDDHPAKKQRRH